MGLGIIDIADKSNPTMTYQIFVDNFSVEGILATKNDQILFASARKYGVFFYDISN